MKENKKASSEGGKIAKRARLDFEKKTGQKVVTGSNFFKKTNTAKLNK